MLDKIAKLPVWAQDHIKRLEAANAPMVEEVARRRRENDTLKERAKRLSESNCALLEILRCAGQGGNDWAAKVVDVLDGYEIFQSADARETLAALRSGRATLMLKQST